MAIAEYDYDIYDQSFQVFVTTRYFLSFKEFNCDMYASDAPENYMTDGVNFPAERREFTDIHRGIRGTLQLAWEHYHED